MKEIIKAHQKNIQNLIISMTGKKNAQDIEQEVYIKIWKNLSRYREQGNLRAWVRRITVNTCKDHLKSKQFSNELKTDLTEEHLEHSDKKLTPDKQLLLKERKNTIIKAVETLKPKLKEVVILYDMQEMSYEEISEKIKCPVGTVKSRLFNARKQLYKEFEERSIL